jgi:hypothetical protein
MKKKFDTFILKKEINKKLPKGIKGVILDKYDNSHFEVEFVKKNGKNIEVDGKSTFIITKDFIN